MSTMTFDRHKGRAHSYDVTAYGFNYRMDEIRGALGLCQIKKQEKDRKLRNSLVTHYLHCLSDTQVKVPFVSEPLSEPVHHIMPVLLPNGTNRPNVMQSLRENGVQTSIHYPAFESFSAYQSLVSRQEATKNCRAISANELTLPLHANLSFSDVEYICVQLRSTI